MPRKTKKEKIISQYRKQIKLLYKEVPNISISAKNEINVVKEVSNVSVSTPAVSPFFYLDLKKSIFLIAGIIILEIGMSFLKLIK